MSTEKTTTVFYFLIALLNIVILFIPFFNVVQDYKGKRGERLVRASGADDEYKPLQIGRRAYRHMIVLGLVGGITMTLAISGYIDTFMEDFTLVHIAVVGVGVILSLFSYSTVLFSMKEDIHGKNVSRWEVLLLKFTLRYTGKRSVLHPFISRFRQFELEDGVLNQKTVTQEMEDFYEELNRFVESVLYMEKHAILKPYLDTFLIADDTAFELIVLTKAIFSEQSMYDSFFSKSAVTFRNEYTAHLAEVNDSLDGYRENVVLLETQSLKLKEEIRDVKNVKKMQESI